MKRSNPILMALMLAAAAPSQSSPPLDFDAPADAGIDLKADLPPPPPGPPHVRRFFEVLREQDPDGYVRLLRLREEDPAAFRAEIAERIEKRRDKKRHGLGAQGPRERPDRPSWQPPAPPGDWHGPHGFELRSPMLEAAERRVIELATSVRTADSAEERKRRIEELKKELERVFDLRDQLRREYLQKAREQLDRMEKGLDERRARKDAIIERRLDELLRKGDSAR